MKKNLVVLTGAGISAESGLKTFRDSDGLWENYRVEDVATPMAWMKDPVMVLAFYNERRRDVLKAQPNAAHKALVKLEEHFNVTIITQNIDDLHERAGSKNIIHLHGEILKSRSSADSDLLYKCHGDILLGDKCELGSQLRPHVVWFHEAVPMMEQAAAVSSEAAILIVVGTSLQVYPAAGLINYAPYSSLKFLVDPNIPEIPKLNNLEIIEAKASDGVPALVERIVEKYKR
ncbi:MAG: NAD-dependent deacylase [Chitinophagaceae bacterium]|nr:NAD-dependent deacylase [Chitinophagaceae bacterium]